MAGKGGAAGQPVPPLLAPLRQRGEGDTPRLLPPGYQAERRNLTLNLAALLPPRPKHLLSSRVRPCPDGSGAPRPPGPERLGKGGGALAAGPPGTALLVPGSGSGTGRGCRPWLVHTGGYVGTALLVPGSGIGQGCVPRLVHIGGCAGTARCKRGTKKFRKEASRGKV